MRVRLATKLSLSLPLLSSGEVIIIINYIHLIRNFETSQFLSPQSLLNIGAMLGGPLGGWMIDFFGRKIALMLTSIPFSGGWLLIGFGKVEGLLYAGRFLSGLGVGMASLIVPVSSYNTSRTFFLCWDGVRVGLLGVHSGQMWCAYAIPAKTITYKRLKISTFFGLKPKFLSRNLAIRIP